MALTSNNLCALLSSIGIPARIFKDEDTSNYVVMFGQSVPVYLESSYLITPSTAIQKIVDEIYLVDTFNGSTGVIWA